MGRVARAKWLGFAPILAVAAVVLSCVSQPRRDDVQGTPRAARADDAIALPLGNLRIGEAPTPADVALSQFLFGTDPQPALRFVKPVDLCVSERGLIVGDGALAALLYWNRADNGLATTKADIAPQAIAAMATAPDGDILVADAASATVLRLNSEARVTARYASPPEVILRPGGVAVVGEEVWISNVAAHRVEIFSSAGAWLRSFGKRGRGTGEFGMPLDIAVTAAGEVAVVDMLNCRVQLFTATGEYVRSLGAPGNVPGTFGRPRTLAVGPDGVIFVTDAASQRVHAFSPAGRSLGAFGGEPGADPLALPAGIAVSTSPVATVGGSAPGKYYVLVAEQLLNPGIRVYAWQGPPAPTPAARRPRPASSEPVELVASPHWTPDGCKTCHGETGGPCEAIPAAQADAICLSCHDGRKASDEAHPIGRLAAGPQTGVPEGWPLVEGRLACLTCHDMKSHCEAPTRPIDNPAFIRGYDAGDPLASCRSCHTSTDTRMNPHRTIETASCGFCHTQPPPIPPDGVPTGASFLRASGSRLCLGCHTMHPDPSPRGHLGAAMTPATLRNLAAAQQRLGETAVAPAGTLLPLTDGTISCFTCHDPHAPGLFGESTPLGRHADPADPYSYHLRLSATALCVACHGK